MKLQSLTREGSFIYKGKVKPKVVSQKVIIDDFLDDLFGNLKKGNSVDLKKVTLIPLMRNGRLIKVNGKVDLKG